MSAELSREEKRAAIAKACGWEICTDRLINYEWAPGHIQQVAAEWKKGELSAMKLPEYFASLDAIHEAEKVIFETEGARDSYEFWLSKVCDPFVIWHATAAQRCEAFGKTLSLW